MTEYKSMKLTELLEESDYNQVELLMNEGKWKELKTFLNSIKGKLEKRGVLADYLYYYLEYSFKGSA